MTDPEDDDFNECDCADKVPANLTEEWTCPKCDAAWYPEDNPMTEEQRAELEKLARAATPGEWRWTDAHLRADSFDGSGIDEYVLSVEYDARAEWATVEVSDADAAYIVAACNALPDLLTTIARLEAEAVKDGEAIKSVLEGLTQHRAEISVDDWIDTLGARLSSRAKDQSQ